MANENTGGVASVITAGNGFAIATREVMTYDGNPHSRREYAPYNECDTAPRAWIPDPKNMPKIA